MRGGIPLSDFMQKIEHINHVLGMVLVILGIVLILLFVLKKTVGKRLYKLIKVTALCKTCRKRNLKGIVFGKKFGRYFISSEKEEGHIFVSGSTGCGKTSAILIPTLRAWRGNFFTIDISGDIEKNVNVKNKAVFEPLSNDSMQYDVFYHIDRMEDVEAKNRALEEIAIQLIPDEKTIGDAGQYFVEEGRNFFSACLIHFYHKGMDFVEICQHVMGSLWDDLIYEIQGSEQEKARLFIGGFDGTNEKNIAGCKQKMNSSIKVFATNDILRRNMRRSGGAAGSIYPQCLEKNSVFVKINDEDLELLAPLLRLISCQFMEYFSKRKETEQAILFALDEFSSFGKMQLLGALRKLRKRKVRIMLLSQDVSDVDLNYGEMERRAIMANISFTVILSVKGPESQKYYADTVGKIYKKADKEKVEEEYLIKPEEFRNTGNYLVLVGPKGNNYLHKTPYYKM